MSSGISARKSLRGASARRSWRSKGFGPGYVDKTAGDAFHTYCLDFGEEVVGCVRLSAGTARGGEVVDVVGVEGCRRGEPILLHPDRLSCNHIFCNMACCI